VLYLYHEKLGDIEKELGNFGKAKDSYKKAIALNPNASWVEVKLNKLNEKKSSHEVVGVYDFYPDKQKTRLHEGGLRIKGVFKKSTKKYPLVTIITAVYDNCHTFQRCIDSVKNQTYPNIEYIVVDGGSPNNTIEIINKNEESIDYFISEKDNGIYSAMNKGISLARGDYVCLLNSDDYYDPFFVEKTIAVTKVSPNAVDVVYTNWCSSESEVVAQPINEGILFGNLNICHCNFLTSKRCYNKVGLYNEDFKVVSDVIWMRDAFLQGVKFYHLPETLFYFSEDGLSSGNSETRRELIISEISKSYQLVFPVLTNDDAREIYLFRFNKTRTSLLCEIVKRYKKHSKIIKALRRYIEHCVRDRPNFKLDWGWDDASFIFPDIIKLIELVDGDKNCIQIDTKHGNFCDILNRIDKVIACRQPQKKKTILHFITVFSAPSETFVYDLLTRLDDENDFDNFVIYEIAELREERPYDKAIQIAWDDYKKPVAVELYKYILDELSPDIVIAHFALNEWKWAQRIEEIKVTIPTISMCHGIDAFAMRNNHDYRNYLVNNFSKRNDIMFTSVSKYLKDELVSNGIEDSKVKLLHNSVNNIFFENRKVSEFYDRKRTLKILAVGRLIELKGHRYLLYALSLFCAKATSDVKLTIVYGNGDEQLEFLKNYAKELNVLEKISFEAFIDFKRKPEYFSNFDLFVHPSTYSSDIFHRSESFGISVLEAISAGLPVITTNAGGLPEVIGEEHRFACVVPHADAKALAKAMIDMWVDGSAFSNNNDYAVDRLNQFSAQSQVSQLRNYIYELSAREINVALFSSSTMQGAGYAAFRVHKGLRSTKINSHMFTTVRDHEKESDVTVLVHPSGDNRYWRTLQVPPKPGFTILTINQPHIDSQKLLKLVEPYDIINLHWHARFLSIENIATLTHSGKPIVMTLRDMMPLTGGCHSFHGCDKWLSDCSNCPQISSNYKDYPAAILAAKRKNYNFGNLTLVTLSEHTRKIAEKVPFFKDCRIETISNSIETDVFRPHDKKSVRDEFGLPHNRKIIGYVPSYSSEVKGYKEILSALKIINESPEAEDPFVMLVGNDTPATAEIALDKKALGYINDNDKLSRAYAAADVIVVPSLEETFSNTTAEAISCGVPVVGFRTGAIPDLAVNGKTGYCCDVGDVKGLAEGIIKVLNGHDMSKACRDHAEAVLSFDIQAKKYEILFNDLIKNAHKSADTLNKEYIFNCFDKPGDLLSKIASEIIVRK